MNNLKISKELFVESIRSILEGMKEDDVASAAIETIIDGYAIVTIGRKYLDTALKLLENAVNDEDETISWWLYEDVPKVITILETNEKNTTGKPIDVIVDTPEKLYDYFEKWN